MFYASSTWMALWDCAALSSEEFWEILLLQTEVPGKTSTEPGFHLWHSGVGIQRGTRIDSSLKCGVSHVSVVYSVHLEGLATTALLICSAVLRGFSFPSVYPLIKLFCTSKTQGMCNLDLLRYLSFIWDKEFPRKILGCCSYGGEMCVLSFLEIQYLPESLQLFQYF